MSIQCVSIDRSSGAYLQWVKNKANEVEDQRKAFRIRTSQGSKGALQKAI